MGVNRSCYEWNMPVVTKFRRRALYFLGGAALALCAIPLAPMIPHSVALHRFGKSFQQLSHPDGTKCPAAFSAVGLIEGNGNHCDYLVGEVRETDKPSSEISEYYKTRSVPRTEPSPENDVPVRLEFVDDFDRREGANYDHALPEAVAKAKSKRTRKTLYIISALDAGYAPEGDFRCH